MPLAAAVELGRAHGQQVDVRTLLAVLRRQAARPQVGWFDDMIVDGNDPREIAHLLTFRFSLRD